jgi:3-dehydroquinate dehydratase-2
VKIPKVEVHISNIYEREDFRKISVIKDECDYSIVGQGIKGYLLAIDYLRK